MSPQSTANNGQELFKTDRVGQNVRSNSLVVYLSSQEGFLSVLKGTSYSRVTQNTKIIKSG